jgi:DNA invertase Pin-like site-specific DNA recombinase
MTAVAIAAAEPRSAEGLRVSARAAVLYAFASRNEPHAESAIEAQLKFLRAVAAKNGIEVAREFAVVEIDTSARPRPFAEMVRFLQCNSRCRMLLVEKSDRLHGNQHEVLALANLDIRIHCVKDGRIFSRDARSKEKFAGDIRHTMAHDYLEGLRDKINTAMNEKASLGIYPARAPFGYCNCKATHSVEVDPQNAAVVQRAFRLCASGRYTLMTLSTELRKVTGTYISRTNLQKMLTNRFYAGHFNWCGHTYRGSYTSLVSAEMYRKAQLVLQRDAARSSLMPAVSGQTRY